MWCVCGNAQRAIFLLGWLGWQERQINFHRPQTMSRGLRWDPRERVLVEVAVRGVLVRGRAWVVECPQQLAVLRVRPPAAERRW